MKTHPIKRMDGSLLAFEITSAWVRFGPLFKILKSVEGVTDIKRQWCNDDRISFKYHGEKAIVNEPWGDNSRYWVGFEDPDQSKKIDLSPLRDAFDHYRGLTLLNPTSTNKKKGA